MNKTSDTKSRDSFPDYRGFSDEELIARMHEATAEYPAIVNFLISRHAGLVRLVVNTLGALTVERDDLLQEGMIGLYEAIEKYDPSRGASFKTYASIEIRGNIYNAIRSNGTQKNYPLRNYISIEEMTDDDDRGAVRPYSPASEDMTPEEYALFRELQEGLKDAMNKDLSETERHALTLKMSGASVKEISFFMGISEKSAENALLRARQKLRSRNLV